MLWSLSGVGWQNECMNWQEKHELTAEDISESKFWDYDDRGMCPVCSIEQGKDIPIPMGQTCTCGGYENESVDHDAPMALDHEDYDAPVQIDVETTLRKPLVFTNDDDMEL